MEADVLLLEPPESGVMKVISAHRGSSLISPLWSHVDSNRLFSVASASGSIPPEISGFWRKLGFLSQAFSSVLLINRISLVSLSESVFTDVLMIEPVTLVFLGFDRFCLT